MKLSQVPRTLSLSILIALTVVGCTTRVRVMYNGKQRKTHPSAAAVSSVAPPAPEPVPTSTIPPPTP